MSFNVFQLHPQVAQGVAAAGYTQPTPIQAEAIPAALSGRDVLGMAQTGTGKTAAFVLPLLHRLMAGPRRRTRALVIAPTRELAEQIDESVRTLGGATGLRSTTVYGGVGYGPQTRALRQGTEIVIACPGRLVDHLSQGTIDLSHLEMLVLDEADQMFDRGFLPAIRQILRQLPAVRQTLLFSATMPDAVRQLADELLRQPVTVQIGHTAPAATVAHALYPVEQERKTDLLLELLRGAREGSVLVFTRTRHRAERLGRQLDKAGFRAASLQGNLSQARRQTAMDGFRSGRFRVLVATDIAARGIDVSQVSHVINYDIPETPETYIHRIGRTGRAERSGEAFTLVTLEDRDKVRGIERLLGTPIERRSLTGYEMAYPDTRPTAPAPRRATDGRGRANGNRHRSRQAPGRSTRATV